MGRVRLAAAALASALVGAAGCAGSGADGPRSVAGRQWPGVPQVMATMSMPSGEGSAQVTPQDGMVQAAVASGSTLVLVTWGGQGCPTVPTGLRRMSDREVRMDLSDAWPDSRRCSDRIVPTTFLLPLGKEKLHTSGLKLDLRGPGDARRIAIAPYRPDLDPTVTWMPRPTASAS